MISNRNLDPDPDPPDLKNFNFTLHYTTSYLRIDTGSNGFSHETSDPCSSGCKSLSEHMMRLETFKKAGLSSHESDDANHFIKVNLYELSSCTILKVTTDTSVADLMGTILDKVEITVDDQKYYTLVLVITGISDSSKRLGLGLGS
jgi:hypothetical protein